MTGTVERSNFYMTVEQSDSLKLQKGDRFSVREVNQVTCVRHDINFDSVEVFLL